MTDRTEIISRITDRIQFLTGAEPASLVNDKPLMGQARIDMLGIAEIENDIEDEFEMGIGALDGMPVDWSIDKIADAVIAAREGR